MSTEQEPDLNSSAAVSPTKEQNDEMKVVVEYIHPIAREQVENATPATTSEESPSTVDPGSLDDDDSELQSITENFMQGERQEVVTPKHSRELKSLLALSKEANLDVNILRKRKSVEFASKGDTLSKQSNSTDSVDASHLVKYNKNELHDNISTIIGISPKSMDISSSDSADSKETKEGSGSKQKKNVGGAVDENGRRIRKLSSNCITMNNERKDPFCWTCHHEDPNLFCKSCPRSFHQKCLRHTASQPNHWMCPECATIMQAENLKQRSSAMQDMTLVHLCVLLKYALKRMQQVGGSEPFIHPVNDEDFPDYKHYIIHPMDLTCLDKNIKKNVYGSPQAFEADAKWILHNSIIFNSYQSKLTSVAKSIMKICKQEMNEIENCATCYLNANTKKKTWFIEVCPKPHVLVWAKLKGFPYWPAKAMRTNQNGLVDVRFFGAHDRAWIHHKECFLYSLKDPNSNKQKKNDIIQSVKELQQHVDNLRKVYGDFQYAPYRVQFEPDQQMKQLQLMLPSYPNKVKLRKSLSKTKTNGNSEVDEDNRQNDKESDSNESDEDDDDDMNETLAEHKHKLLNASSTDEFDCSTYNDSESETKSPLPRNVRGSSVRMRGGIANVTGKIKVLPKLVTLEPGKRKRPSSEEMQIPNKLMRRNSDQSDVSIHSNASDKINKVDITENMEVNFRNKSVSFEDLSESDASKTTSDGTPESKRQTAIQIHFGLNENSEISITPKSKSKISDHIMKKLVEPDNLAESKQKDNEDAREAVGKESSSNDYLNELKNKSLTILEKVTELSPDTDIFDNPDASCDSKDFDRSIENMTDYEQLLCSEEIHLDDKENILSNYEQSLSDKSNDEAVNGDLDNPDGNEDSDLSQSDSGNANDGITQESNEHVDSSKDSVVTSTSTEGVGTEVHQNEEDCEAEVSTQEEVMPVNENDSENTTIDSSQNEQSTSTAVENSTCNQSEESPSPAHDKTNEQSEQIESNNLAGFGALQRNKITLVNVEDIRQKNLIKSLKPPANSTSILENRLVSRRQSSQSDKDSSDVDPSVVVIKSEPSSEDEPSDTEYLEKKRKYLSALNISERMPKKPKPNEIRTRSKTEDKKFRIVDNISKVIDDVATHYSLNHANEEVTITRTTKKKEIFVKPLPTLQELKPRARKSFPSIKSINVYPSQKKDVVKVCKSITTPISSIKSPPTTTAVSSTSNSTNVVMFTPTAPINTISLLPTNQSLSYPASVAKSVITMVQHPNGTVGSLFIQPTAVSVGSVSTNTNIESQNYIPQSGAPSKTITVNASKNTVGTVATSSMITTTSIVPLSIATASPNANDGLQSNNAVEELQTLTGSVPEPLSRSITEIMVRAPPKLKPRPPGPLSTQFSEGVPSVAGNVTSRVNSISHRLSDYFRGMLIELLKESGSSTNPEAEITKLKLENEEMKHKHAEEMLEIKKNISSVLKDMQKSMTDEKNRAVEETRTSCEQETVKRVEEAKSKQWCASCLKEAQFYCCWNTSYCDYPCQQKHWPTHMSKCTQQIQSSQLQCTPTTTVKTSTQQPLVLRQTAPPKGFKTTIIGKSTKVLLNRPSINKVPIGFARASTANHITLVESTPGNYELVGNGGPISVGGKFITNLGKIKAGSVISVNSSSSPICSVDSTNVKATVVTQSQSAPSPSKTSSEGKNDGI